VTHHVGDALISERSPRLRSGRVVSIGVAPWGVVENRASLVGRKKDVAYQSIDHPRSKYAALNNRHSYFLLADNGTVGQFKLFNYVLIGYAQLFYPRSLWSGNSSAEETGKVHFQSTSSGSNYLFYSRRLFGR
jgi:hypothetical protein